MRVRVRNFQSLQQVDLDIEGYTVILGPSNIGKSALIRAITSAFYGRPGEDFVRKGAPVTEVDIWDAPKAGGGTINIEWHKGKGVNKFVIDGAIYDKVARETPIHLTKAGYHEIDINGEYIRPQISEQHDRLFLLDRAGSFVHDVIAQASRLSVLLRADRNCSSDLKRQKSLQKIRQGDLLDAFEKLEQMAPIRELHTRIHTLKPKVLNLRSIWDRLEDLKQIAVSRKQLLDITNIQLPVTIEIPLDLIHREGRLVEIQRLAQERKLYLSLPKEVPSAKPFDFDGLMKISSDIETARALADERRLIFKEYRESQISFKSITQELEMSEAELARTLESIDICPVCERPMPGKEVNAEIRVG